MGEDQKKSDKHADKPSGGGEKPPEKSGKPSWSPRFNNSRWNKSQQENDGQKSWEGPIEEIKNHTFIYASGMSEHNRRSKEKLIEYVGNNYGRSIVRSLEQGRLVLVGVTTPDLSLTARELGNMIPAEQEEYKLEVKFYKNAKMNLTSEDAKLSSSIFSMCTMQLKHKL